MDTPTSCLYFIRSNGRDGRDSKKDFLEQNITVPRRPRNISMTEVERTGVVAFVVDFRYGMISAGTQVNVDEWNVSR